MGEAEGAGRAEGAAPATLRRGLSAFNVQMISLGGIIGSCYFLGIGDTVSRVGPATALSLLLGGAIVWLVANAMGELCVGLPRSGSFVSYAGELVSRPWAAGVGWSYWINWCAYVPSEMVAAGIIMNGFVPSVPVMVWAILFGGLLTFVNLRNVKSFGAIESTLAMIKISAIALFCVIGLLLWTGAIGQQGFLGARVLTGGRGLEGLAPAGVLAILNTMVIILVNYQGTEIVALSAAETENPEKNIPVVIRNVAFRIVAIFVLPVAILVSIYPSSEAGLEGSVFAAALAKHGLSWAGSVLSGVVLVAALSCANSGMYGNTRALYSLAREGLAPRALAKLNKNQVPARATLATVGLCWAFIPLFSLFKGTSFYTWLLSVSGFTGAVCWISISWCQLRFRRRVRARGYRDRDLPFRAPLFPYLAHVAIWAQLGCLVFVALNPTLRACLVIGVPAVIVPLGIAQLIAMRGGLKAPPLPPGERSFDELYPPREEVGRG